MKKDKWYNKILGYDTEAKEMGFKDKRLEVYELFKKNRYKKPSEREEQSFIKKNI